MQSLATWQSWMQQGFRAFVVASLALLAARLVVIVLLLAALLGIAWPMGFLLIPAVCLIVGGIGAVVCIVWLWRGGDLRVRRVLTGKLPITLLAGCLLDGLAGAMLLAQANSSPRMEEIFFAIACLTLPIATAFQWQRGDILNSLASVARQPHLGEQVKSTLVIRTVAEVALVVVPPFAVVLGSCLIGSALLLVCTAILVYVLILIIEFIGHAQLALVVAPSRRSWI